ncbi:phosphatase PAP2 family protein [Arthrobacter sp. E3]|uniref:phosphatase PAP2 family protein n=1 Tax=Arthrobacter sp. E3 TaxID=517402 RepID=UPI001A943D4C|nr:phosphatase PAP2 family protein [Arthrobacter sp. E3]
MAPPPHSSNEPGILFRTRLAVLPQPAYWGLWVAVLSVAVLAIGFYAVGTPDFSTGEFTIDQQLSRSHVGILTFIAMSIGTVFSPVGGVLIIAALCLFLLIVRKSPVNAVAFGGVAAFGWLSSQFFKAIVERPRPNPALLFDPLAPETGSNSFPSGHVALVVGFAWAFFFLLRNGPWAKPAVVLGVLVSVAVAWSRLYEGVHYPSDVIASFLAASAGVLLFCGLWNRFQAQLLPRIPLLARFGPVAAPKPEHNAAGSPRPAIGTTGESIGGRARRPAGGLASPGGSTSAGSSTTNEQNS